jgi:hypothetical protein
MGASERQDHVRVRACALARASKGKERRGEERGNTILFVMMKMMATAAQ